MRVLGCDFSSSPTRRKPIVHAHGRADASGLRIDGFETFTGLSAWRDALHVSGPWVGGFDLPFGLPRDWVVAQDWPIDWHACMTRYVATSRDELKGRFKAYCDARPSGQKMAHRATDRWAGSSPSMKWVNPPVAWMMHAGMAGLLAAGVHLPRLHRGDPQRVALEAYPGHWAKRCLGGRSYKSDDRSRQTPSRREARAELLAAVQSPSWAGLAVHLSEAVTTVCLDDASGDHLDAVICAAQAAWGHQRWRAGDPHWGLPVCDPLEGWIVGVLPDVD